MTESADVVVIGAGVVGLACARALALAGRDVVVLERHRQIGTETSSRNSEVIHAGIYYPTDSLKARLCVAGKRMLYRYCAEHGVAHRRCGKIIVASSDEQIPVLRQYQQQAERNGAGLLRWISGDELRVMEPAVNAVAGVLSESTGIVDSHAFMLALRGDLEAAGGMIAFGTEVTGLVSTQDGLRVGTRPAVEAVADQVVGGISATPGDAPAEPLDLVARVVINAAGLHAPGVAGWLCADAPAAYYARGRYYAYEGASPFSRLVYPVAEAGGLGVHVTLDLGGQARFGPDVAWIDEVSYAFDDSRRGDFEAAIRRYFPGLDPARLHPGYTGIRPKISPPEAPAADFRIDGPEVHRVPGLVNLLGIESPGLTASLAIGRWVADRVAAAC